MATSQVFCRLSHSALHPPDAIVRCSRRAFWGWLNAVFNRVDPARIKEVGTDRACTEWLIRCGASVKWKNSHKWHNDYNALPLSGFRNFKIEEIDATDSSVMSIGFAHLKGVEHVRRIIFHRCMYLDDEALSDLKYVRETLESLQVSSCGNITEKGILSLQHLTKLQYLLLFDLPEIQDKNECVNLLKTALPQCQIEFPYAQAKDAPKDV